MCCILDSLLSDLVTLIREFVLDSKCFRAVLGFRWLAQVELLTSGAAPHQPNAQLADQLTSRPSQSNSIGLTTTTTTTNKQRAIYSYKMMSKKGLLKFVKYTLIFSNAFGFILSIFLGLFGIAYPDKHFPLSYKGREMALCSLFCMLFTTIGYCGAQNHRRILLIIYGATNVIIVIIVVILWFLFRENSILGNKEISNMFITTLAITIAVMFLFAFILAFHIKTFKEDQQDSIVSQSHQLLQQTTAFLQQQQQQHQQQQASLLGAQAAVAATSTLPMHAAGHHQVIGPPHHQQQQQLQQSQQHSHPLSLSSHDSHPAYMPTSAPSMSGGHYHTMGGNQPGGLHRQALGMRAPMHLDESSNQAGGFQLMMPPPPPPVKLHAHLKSSISSSANRNKKTLQPHVLPGQPVPPSMPPASGAAGSHQMSLMRNQSSPLPGVHQVVQQQQQASCSVRSSQSKQVTSSQQQQQQQHYSQSQKSLRGGPHQQQGSPPSPPPPPPPGSQQQQHHQQSNRTGSMANQNQRIPAACPVQYCAFDCDQTV